MYIELKAFQTPREGSAGVKTKIQLNVGTPFSADTKAEIGKEKLEPKKVHDVLHFIAHDLIPRVAIKHNQQNFATELAELARLKGKWPSWDDFFANASVSDLQEFKEKEKAMLLRAVSILDTLNLPDDIFQLSFDELSPGTFAASTRVIVNINVPPPRFTIV